MNISIEPYSPDDEDALWEILQPAIAEGDVFAWPMDAERALGLKYWLARDHKVFMAREASSFRPEQSGVEESRADRKRDPSASLGMTNSTAVITDGTLGMTTDGKVVGSYYIGPNQQGGGAHVANCGYVVSSEARGMGIARRMCEHSLQTAKEMGYRAVQFNFVVSTNADAVHLWKSLGFEIVGTLPGAFLHPTLGYVDAFVMWRELGV